MQRYKNGKINYGLTYEDELDYLITSWNLGVDVNRQVRVTTGYDGRKIIHDLGIYNRKNGKTMIVEAKSQDVDGTAWQKIPYEAFIVKSVCIKTGIDGVVVFTGNAIPEYFKEEYVKYEACVMELPWNLENGFYDNEANERFKKFIIDRLDIKEEDIEEDIKLF